MWLHTVNDIKGFCSAIHFFQDSFDVVMLEICIVTGSAYDIVALKACRPLPCCALFSSLDYTRARQRSCRCIPPRPEPGLDELINMYENSIQADTGNLPAVHRSQSDTVQPA